MKRLLCWIIGHRWKNFGGNKQKVIGLAHLHPLAGLICVCERCKSMWDDYLWGLDVDDPESLRYYQTRMKLAIGYQRGGAYASQAKDSG